MTITIGLANGRKITFGRDTVTIGRGPGVDLAIASEDVQPVHARIVRVAGRWMVESAGDWLLQVGDSVPGRKQWLEPGQVICLTESGVTVVFEPRMSQDEQPSEAEDTEMCLGSASRGRCPLRPLRFHRHSPPVLLKRPVQRFSFGDEGRS